jgi:IMP dehydrogenase/GMP reductase
MGDHTLIEQSRFVGDAITFDDVLLTPAYSELHPTDASLASRLTRNVEIKIPLVSAPMDTVTESRLAIALAQEGGIGIIHKNMPLEVQAIEVQRGEALGERGDHRPDHARARRHRGQRPPPDASSTTSRASRWSRTGRAGSRQSGQGRRAS